MSHICLSRRLLHRVKNCMCNAAYKVLFTRCTFALFAYDFVFFTNETAPHARTSYRQHTSFCQSFGQTVKSRVQRWQTSSQESHTVRDHTLDSAVSQRWLTRKYQLDVGDFLGVSSSPPSLASCFAWCRYATVQLACTRNRAGGFSNLLCWSGWPPKRRIIVWAGGSSSAVGSSLYYNAICLGAGSAGDSCSGSTAAPSTAAPTSATEWSSKELIFPNAFKKQLLYFSRCKFCTAIFFTQVPQNQVQYR